MKTRSLPLSLLVMSLLLTSLLTGGCSALGTKKGGGNNDAKVRQSLPADQICQMLAHPSFESRHEYDGAGCSGSTYFGARDTRTASYESDLRPSFSYAAMGEQGDIKKVMITMTKRPDGAEFFATQADAVAKLINDQPLPTEIATAITGTLPASGGDFTTKSQIGNAAVELTRSNTDSRFYLTFQF